MYSIFFSQIFINGITGILGAVIMPHNIFLHSSLVLSRKIDRSSKFKIKEAAFYNMIESALALLFTFIVNVFIVAVFARLFFDSPDNLFCDKGKGLSNCTYDNYILFHISKGNWLNLSILIVLL